MKLRNPNCCGGNSINNTAHGTPCRSYYNQTLPIKREFGVRNVVSYGFARRYSFRRMKSHNVPRKQAVFSVIHLIFGAKSP